MPIEHLHAHLSTLPRIIQSANSLAKTFEVPTTSVTRVLRRLGYTKSPLDGYWHLSPQSARLTSDDSPSFLIDTLSAYVLVIDPDFLNSYRHTHSLPVDDETSTEEVAVQFIKALITLHNRGVLPIRSKMTTKGFEPL